MTDEVEEMLGELWEQLEARVDYEARDPYHKLSHEERVFMLVFWYYLDANNGGDSQFILNSGGDRYAETIAAMEEIGAHDTADFLRTVEKRFKEETGNGFSMDTEERREQLAAYGREEFRALCDGEWKKQSDAPGFVPGESVRCLVPYVNLHREK